MAKSGFLVLILIQGLVLLDIQNQHPNILLICDAKRGISSDTLASFAKYAKNSPFLCKPNYGIDIENGDRIQNYRLELIQHTNAEYVLFIDDDDELIRPIPSNSELNDADVVFFPFLTNWEKEVDFFNEAVHVIYAYCGTIVKREWALKAFEHTVQRQYFREDIGFFHYLAKYCPNQMFAKYPIINKISQREPQRSAFIKRANQQELGRYWKPKIAKLRGK
jgi:hypothetical protein